MKTSVSPYVVSANVAGLGTKPDVTAEDDSMREMYQSDDNCVIC
jgi:hypothetical protein